jgi:hypothetical protein
MEKAENHNELGIMVVTIPEASQPPNILISEIMDEKSRVKFFYLRAIR